jgi:hypothetical protein
VAGHHVRPYFSRLWRWQPPREVLAILGGLAGGLVFAQIFVWIFAKDTASTYEAYVGPALERVGVPWTEITTAIEAGAARSISDLLTRYEGMCRRDPFAAAERHIDCKEVYKLRSQAVPHD